MKLFLFILFVEGTEKRLYEWVKRGWLDRDWVSKIPNSTHFTILPKASPELSPNTLEIRLISKNQQSSLNIDEQEREYVRMD